MVSARIHLIKNYQISHHAYVDIFGALKEIPVWFNLMQYDFLEKGLSEKEAGAGHEIDSEWIATRDVTDYLQFEIKLRFLAKDVKKVVLESGEETYWARLLVVIDSTLIKDPKNTFEENWYDKFVQKFYDRFLMKKKIKGYAGRIIVETLDLISKLKRYLK